MSRIVGLVVSPEPKKTENKKPEDKESEPKKTENKEPETVSSNGSG